MLESAVSGFLESAGLDLPVSAQAITAWIGWFWTGMEASMMLGITERCTFTSGDHSLERISALPQWK